MIVAPAWFTPVQTQLNNMQNQLNYVQADLNTLRDRVDQNGMLLRTVVQSQAIVSVHGFIRISMTF